jgi:hypothetical protein
MLSKQEAFKFGFITNCVEEGLSIEDMRARVKKASDCLDALEKQGGGFSEIVDDAGDLFKTVARTAGGALLFAPPALGAAAGYIHSKATDVDDDDVEDIKSQELIDEYERQAERLRQTKRLRELEARSSRPRGLYL